jgi:hypothetical protein
MTKLAMDLALLPRVSAIAESQKIKTINFLFCVQANF